MLYACDGRWWIERNGVPEFNGLKLSQDTAACVRFADVHKIEVDPDVHRFVFENPGHVGSGKNSGFQIANLIMQWGCRRIVLVGFDMHLDRGIHWHGRHGRGLNNPSKRVTMFWRETLDGQAKLLRERGIEVVNASADSALTEFPKMPLAEALARWQPQPA